MGLERQMFICSRRNVAGSASIHAACGPGLVVMAVGEVE